MKAKRTVAVSDSLTPASMPVTRDCVADIREIITRARRHLVISGILSELYPEVLAAYVERGFSEVSRKTLGEWTTGLLIRQIDG